MSDKAIKITMDAGGGYGHVYVALGTIRHDDHGGSFSYVVNPDAMNYEQYRLDARCQLGHGDVTEPYDRSADPYAIRYAIQDNHEDTLAAAIAQGKSARMWQRKFEKIDAEIGRAITFEDYALRLWLAYKPAYWEFAGDPWIASGHDARRVVGPCSVDDYLEAVRRAVRSVQVQLGLREVA